MKAKNLLLIILAAFVLVSLNSCSPKTKKVVIDNSTVFEVDGGIGIRPVPNGEPGQNEVYGIKYLLMWDVAVQLNGVDFGVIEGGTVTDSVEVPDANNLKVEKFDLVKNDAGLALYFMKDDEKVYVDFNAEPYNKVKDMERCNKDLDMFVQLYKDVDQAGGLLNNDWKWEISYKDAHEFKRKKDEEKNKKKK